MSVKELLLRYARYNQWAHTRLLDLINTLSTQQHHAVIPSSFKSLYKTVFHVWEAERLWLARLSLEIPALAGDPFDGFMNLSVALEALDQQWVDWVISKDDDSLTEKFITGTWQDKHLKSPMICC
jgi:uncharacterized damage-inducible protein DinB